MDGRHPIGGSRTLGLLIDQYGEYIATDLTEIYDIDLRDVLVPGSGVTPRWLLVHIKNLPISSRFYAEQRGGQEFRGWDESRYAQVAVVNAVRALTWTYIAAHAKRKPPPFKPYPMPERKTRQADKPGSFAHTALSMMAAAKKRKAMK